MKLKNDVLKNELTSLQAKNRRKNAEEDREKQEKELNEISSTNRKLLVIVILSLISFIFLQGKSGLMLYEILNYMLVISIILIISIILWQRSGRQLEAFEERYIELRHEIERLKDSLKGEQNDSGGFQSKESKLVYANDPLKKAIPNPRDQFIPMTGRSTKYKNGAGTNPARPPTKNEKSE